MSRYRRSAWLLCVLAVATLTVACREGSGPQGAALGPQPSTSLVLPSVPDPPLLPLPTVVPLPEADGLGPADPAGGLDATGCPSPRDCGLYALGERLRLSDGRIVVRYQVNPSGAETPHLGPTDIVSAIRAATRAWSAADSRIVFRYEGVTDLPFGTPGVVGFGTPCGHGSHPACAASIGDGWSITFARGAPWTWSPCGPFRGGAPCEPYDQPCRREGGTIRCEGIDLQAVATHEWGHVLGLADLSTGLADGLTMYARASMQELPGARVRRDLSTLALGDLRGLRALYPSDEPMPEVVVP